MQNMKNLSSTEMINTIGGDTIRAALLGAATSGIASLGAEFLGFLFQREAEKQVRTKVNYANSVDQTIYDEHIISLASGNHDKKNNEISEILKEENIQVQNQFQLISKLGENNIPKIENLEIKLGCTGTCVKTVLYKPFKYFAKLGTIAQAVAFSLLGYTLYSEFMESQQKNKDDNPDSDLYTVAGLSALVNVLTEVAGAVARAGNTEEQIHETFNSNRAKWVARKILSKEYKTKENTIKFSDLETKVIYISKDTEVDITKLSVDTQNKLVSILGSTDQQSGDTHKELMSALKSKDQQNNIIKIKKDIEIDISTISEEIKNNLVSALNAQIQLTQNTQNEIADLFSNYETTFNGITGISYKEGILPKTHDGHSHFNFSGSWKVGAMGIIFTSLGIMAPFLYEKYGKDNNNNN